MTAEDRIHLALLLALCAASAVLLSRPPSPSAGRARAARAALADSSAELSRAELDATIARVRAWLERAQNGAQRGSEQEAALRGLGPTTEDRTNPERWLSRWLGPEVLRAWLSNAAAERGGAKTRTELTAALVILLEAGVPASQPLGAPAGELVPGPRLGELVQRVLDSEPPAPEAASPWQLDLLALAVLDGMTQYREHLARATRRELRRLDQRERARDLPPGAGDPSPEQLETWASEWRARQGQETPGALELHWSATVFRAAAVLGEAPLTTAARQHQLALLGRYRSDRALYRYLEATARDPRERERVLLGALENLGRFEEALFNAHVTFQRGVAPAPGSETARVMRLAARDLIERWGALEASSLSEGRTRLPAQDRTLQVRAAVHVLRGLRSARVAG